MTFCHQIKNIAYETTDALNGPDAIRLKMPDAIRLNIPEAFGRQRLPRIDEWHSGLKDSVTSSFKASDAGSFLNNLE